MRFASCLALVTSLLLPAISTAQRSPRDKVEVQAVRFGFSPGPTDGGEDNAPTTRSSLYKAGAWTPVYIDLVNINRYDPDPKKDGPAVLIVEAPDCDDIANTYSVPVPAFDEQEGLAGRASIVAYTRSASRYGEITIRVMAGNRELCQPFKLGQQAGGFTTADALDPNQGLYLALGTRVPGLRGLGKREPEPNQPGNVVNMADDRKAAVGLLARISDMPAVWFGYAAADVVILSTSDRDFVNGLLNDRVRTAALAEWVRRGGRIVILAGGNADVLNGQTELNAMLPIQIGKPYTAPALTFTWRQGGGAGEPLADPDPKKSLSFTGLVSRDKPARGFLVLADGPAGVPGATPVVVQGAYGLGRVTVVAFDADKPPVAAWAAKHDFWRQLLSRSGPQIPNSAGANHNVIYYRGRPNPEGTGDGEQDAINRHLESFEGVPVISFGWVALFILLYILVVGPLDYLFLKKVVKRLELTWITFPTVVLGVSAAAYFTAYHLKGSELRINKLDLVDIDQQTGRAYGRTWFSVFSPRIQKYTIGVDPASPWAGQSDAADPAVTVSWFGRAQESRQELFRQSYDYANRAVGLRGVPIQVWTTKGFQSDWTAPLTAGASPIENHLRHPPGRPDALIGNITSRLPVSLEDVLMIYRGEVSSLGPLLPDTAKTVPAQGGIKFSSLRDDPAKVTGTNDLRLSLLFHEAWTRVGETNNGSLRDLDQSWRVSDENRDEVILVGRLPQEKGEAEDVTKAPETTSRLWLNKLPIDGGERPPLRGKMRQDTIVRIFLPLTPEPQSR